MRFSFRTEPAVILGVIGSIVVAIQEAMTDGVEFQSAVVIALPTIVGIITRQLVYAPDTVAQLADYEGDEQRHPDHA